MRKLFAVCLVLFAMTTLPVLAADNLMSEELTGPAPTINGTRSSLEWTGVPTLVLPEPTYPIETEVFFRHDASYLYVLVDAVGDVNDNQMDECLLVFGLPPSHKIAEIWKDAANGTSANDGTVADQYAMGMYGGHRIYEFRIPFAGLGITPGESIPFYSPRIMKGPGWYGASMPYDAQDGRDNEYPLDLVVTTEFNGSGTTILGVTGYSTLQAGAGPVPTMGGWGLLLLGLLIAGGSFLSWRRREQA
jgi:hypothetical protein